MGEELKPREYAALILGKRPEPDFEYLNRAIERVPVKWQMLVKCYVVIAWDKRP